MWILWHCLPRSQYLYWSDCSHKAHLHGTGMLRACVWCVAYSIFLRAPCNRNQGNYMDQPCRVLGSLIPRLLAARRFGCLTAQDVHSMKTRFAQRDTISAALPLRLRKTVCSLRYPFHIKPTFARLSVLSLGVTVGDSLSPVDAHGFTCAPVYQSVGMSRAH